MHSLTPAEAESYDASTALAGHCFPPIPVLDWQPTAPVEFKVSLGLSVPGRLIFDARRTFTDGFGANEGRLRAELRAAARNADPVFSLCESARAFARGDAELGRAFADLSVTGKRSFARFRQSPSSERDLAGCTASAEAIASALDRAYDVASILRFGDARRRRRLGWIAVSGEDDQPHRPVNVPSAGFPQYDLTVTVPVRSYNGAAPPAPITLNTRYMIACPPSAGTAIPSAPAGRQVLEDPAPALAPDAEVVLFIHGMDSRLEEALDLTHALHRIAAQTGKQYTVIAMDLPTSGYADNVDHFEISPLDTVGVARFRPAGSHDVRFTRLRIFDAATGPHAPALDFIEDFIIAFVETLDRRIPGLKQQVRAVVGGSLGGSMAMRLGRRPDQPWIRAVVPWSPAGVWPSFAGGNAVTRITQHLALAIPWLWAGGDRRAVPEADVMRRLFFYYGFDWRMGVPGALTNRRPQAEEWFRDDWSGKAARIFGARLDRHETYDARFRLWHWRLALEQLVFSHQLESEITGEPLYMQNTTRMLLVCGYDDTGGDLCTHARAVAGKMTRTPGQAVFLRDTGHSIASERPAWLARAIVDFLEGRSVIHPCVAGHAGG